MSEILTRLRGYNPPDRTIDTERTIAQDISDAADEIERLRLALETATRELETYRAEHDGCIDIWRTTCAAGESHIRELVRERDEAQSRLHNKWLLEEEYEAACRDKEAMARMVDDLRSRVRATCAMVEEWLDGNARLGRPKSIADQRFLNGLNAAMPPTFTHWLGTATKPEEP